jgi:hypothetical protein
VRDTHDPDRSLLFLILSRLEGPLRQRLGRAGNVPEDVT